MTNLLAFKPANPFVCIGLEPLCRLFLLFSALVSFVFNRLRPLLRKHPGWEYHRRSRFCLGVPVPRWQPEFCPASRSSLATPHWCRGASDTSLLGLSDV